MGDEGLSLTVLGVYRVPVDEEELREQLRRFYFSGNVLRDTASVAYSFVDSCIPLVLFEIQLDNLDERFRNRRLHARDACCGREGVASCL